MSERYNLMKKKYFWMLLKVHNKEVLNLSYDCNTSQVSSELLERDQNHKNVSTL